MSGPSQLKSESRELLHRLKQVVRDDPLKGSVSRVSLDVCIDGECEIVTIRLHNDSLKWSCSCGTQECKHILTALSWISAGDSGRESYPTIDSDFSKRERGSSSWPPDLRVVQETDQVERVDRSALSTVLEDIVTSIVRSGVDAGETPSVEEAIQRLISAAPRPIPLGISRWIGRLREALDTKDVDSVARILDSATRIAEDLSNLESTDQDSKQRLISWLGALSHDTKAVTRISDCVFLEIAREWLDGIERSSIERRYLLDLDVGVIYREERARGMLTASLGPCPRLIVVGLATVEQGVHPQRVRLMQYSITTVISMDHWYQLLSWARQRFSTLIGDYKEAIGIFPGLAEPFALIAPASLKQDPHFVPLDEVGRPLPLALTHDPSSIKFIQTTIENGSLAWVSGRLVDAKGVLMLQPLSVGVRLEDGLVLRRV